MIKFVEKTTLLIITSVLVFSCTPGKKQDQEETADTTSVSKLKVYKAPSSPEYADATLELTQPADAADLDTGAVSFTFNVTNYELGTQTPDASSRGIANSDKGQHIHLIVNNGPYTAHYEPEFSKKFEAGEYVILAFLSRSYHESVKNEKAFVVRKISVGDSAQTLDFDPNGQHLFYSRPKGTYAGADTEKLLLDFYLFNTSLSPGGNKVRATVNGEEFLFDEWAPYYIEGLDKGEVTVKLELIDNQGNVIPGPFNVAERKVTLE